MFVRTQRLTLRPGWIEDAPELARAISHWEVVRNLSRVPWPYTLSDAERFLAEMRAGRHGASFLICGREGAGAPIIGGVGFDRDAAGAYQLGYWLMPSAWGQGYATEAAGAVIALARTLGIGTLVAAHWVDNPASGAVLRKLGFHAVGSGLRHCRSRDALVESVDYALELVTSDAQRLAA